MEHPVDGEQGIPNDFFLFVVNPYLPQEVHSGSTVGEGTTPERAVPAVLLTPPTQSLLAHIRSYAEGRVAMPAGVVSSSSSGPMRVPHIAQPRPVRAYLRPTFISGPTAAAHSGILRSTSIPRISRPALGFGMPSAPNSWASMHRLHVRQILYQGESSSPVEVPPFPTFPCIKRPPSGSFEIGIRAAAFSSASGGNATLRKAKAAGLYNASETADLGGTQKISHRLEIVVLDPSGQLVAVPYNRQVSGRTANSSWKHLTVAAVFSHAAKTVHKFMKKHAVNGELVLPSGVRVTFDDLVVLGLLRVTRGSFQILLGYGSA